MGEGDGPTSSQIQVNVGGGIHGIIARPTIASVRWAVLGEVTFYDQPRLSGLYSLVDFRPSFSPPFFVPPHTFF